MSAEAAAGAGVGASSGLRVLAAHPLGDRYGADRMLVEALAGLVEAGAHVEVTMAVGGPLVGDIEVLGVPVHVVDAPVLRKAYLSPVGLIRFAIAFVPGLLRAVRAIRAAKADVVYVNTITLPVWLVAGRLTRRQVVCHVREAEEGSKVLGKVLHLPLLLAHRLIANSAHTAAALGRVWPRLGRRTTVVYNGFDFPPAPAALSSAVRNEPPVVTIVGRLNARKGQDVALDALGLLAQRGVACHLRLVGNVFPGYEWWEDELRQRIASEDLDAELAGFMDRWEAYEGADVVAVPSRVEPFGNVAVEAMALGRPVVASRAGGLAEIVTDGVTGVLATPGDAASLADALEGLLTDPDRAAQLAAAGAAEVRERFSQDRYRAGVLAVLSGQKV